MSEALAVLLEGEEIGVLHRQRGRLRLEYGPGGMRPGRTPLSLSMPPSVASHPDGVVTPWLWGLLPENGDVLARWARQFHTSASSPFSLLSTPVGEDCAGAVQFAPPDRLDELLGRRGSVEWLEEDEVAARLRALRADGASWLGPALGGQWSLAGAQAKVALCHEGGRWGVPSGKAPTTHILKPAIAGLDDHDLNEHLCLDAARRAGLAAARTRVVRFGDQTAVAVERYDRALLDGDRVRVHQEDVCQALGVPPTAKYQAEGGPSPRQVVELLRRVMRAERAEEAVGAFVDALAWNWIIAGTDAHAKNYSLLLAGDQVRLAPLYDVASALPYEGAFEPKLELAMKLAGEYRLGAPRQGTWLGVATELGLDAEGVVARVRALAEAAPDAFADAAAHPDVQELGRPLPGRLVAAVAARARRCHRALEVG